MSLILLRFTVLEFHFTLAKTPSVDPAVASKVKTAPKKRNKSIVNKSTVSATSTPIANIEPATSVKTSAVLVKVATKPKPTKKTVKKIPASVQLAEKQNSAVVVVVPKARVPRTSVAKKATKATANKTAAKNTRKTSEPEKSWYDYPHYYDVGFREDTPREAKFFEKAFAKYIPGKVKRLFEPGCGSGRLVVKMADRGFQVTGLDLNQPALDYCKQQLDKLRLKATLMNGDMTNFQLKRPADAAFNTINTFRHLLTEEDAVKHLKCVAANLRPGGIYILGLHLLPTGGDFYGSEKWKAKEGRTNISYSLTVVDSMPKERHERLKITMTIKTGKKVVRVSDHFTLRLYNYRNIKTLFAQVPELVLRDVYDFWYEIDEPQKLDGNIADSVFILQKPE